MSKLIKKIFLLVVLVSGWIFNHGWASDESALIIDVRTAQEWDAGHLAAATHLQLENVAAGIQDLAKDRDQIIYLYCRSGNRSGQALQILERQGYSNVINAGGIADASKLLNQQIVSD